MLFQTIRNDITSERHCSQSPERHRPFPDLGLHRETKFLKKFPVSLHDS